MAEPCPPPPAPILQTRDLAVSADGRALIRGVNLDIAPGQVYGLIGPSGAGKSTLLRTLNRLSDLIPGLRVTGDVTLHGRSIFAAGTDVNALRARIGMLFQQPVVFPASIAENVLFGARRLRSLSRGQRNELVESALQEAALWSEVKDRLRAPARALSVGQQQRLCLARTLAVEPEVILMDEPTSALDPRSTEAIEELIRQLKVRRTIVLVTHNVAQARRLADGIACLCLRAGVGEIVESAPGDTVLTNPQCCEVMEYLSQSS